MIEEKLIIPNIYIFPQLKEISGDETIGFRDGCDSFQQFRNSKTLQSLASVSGKLKKVLNKTTYENCMADYDNGDYNNKNKMIRRENYNKCNISDTPIRCQPNTFITEGVDVEFVSENPEFKINEHKQNWVKLFNSIQSIITKIGNSGKKPKVFLAGHQHSFQHKFFSLNHKNAVGTYIKENGEEKKKKFGFRNCTCIKITSDDIKIVSPIQSSEGEKPKYQFLDNGTIKHNLISGTYELDHTVLNLIDGLYMIRHGQALHNYRDLYTNRPEDPAELKRYLIGDSILDTVYLNSCLTPQGINQAKSLYTNLHGLDATYNDGDILISSPMDRAIQTLVEGVTPPDKFFDLKEKFKTMYEERFPKATLLIPLSPVQVPVPLGGKRTTSKTLKKRPTRRHNRRKLVSTSKKFPQKKRTRVKNYLLKRLK